MFTFTDRYTARASLLAAALATVLAVSAAAAEEADAAAGTAGTVSDLGGASVGQISTHAGVGFDVLSGGAAVSLGLGYRIPMGSAGWMEGAADAYHHSSEEDWVEGNYSGVEKTEFNVFALRMNYLYGYGRSKAFPIVGFGLFVAGLEWSETEVFRNDPSTTAYDDFEGSAFGSIFNFGFGFSASERVDLRFETPVMVFWGVEHSAVALPLTATASVTF
jgi:hypothetical protein